MIEHNVKFVFNKIRFSSGYNLIENDPKTFHLHQDRARFKEPKQELDNDKLPRLISPFDCYLQCIKQPDCSSFAFCKHKPTWSDQMTTKCQLSDQVLLGDHHEANRLQQKRSKQTLNRLYSAWNSVRKFLLNGQQDAEKDVLVEDKNCETFSVNYLKHFKNPDSSMLATVESMLSEQVDSQEDCAKQCYSFNQDEANKQKCGKLEVCHDSDRKEKAFQCNLKPFASDNEIQLKNQGCEYYKINSLVDYHQVELNEERDHLEEHPIENDRESTIENCAKDCTGAGDACKEFNFCWTKTPEEHSYEEEFGFCLWRKKEKADVPFNVSEKALNCVTMIRNDYTIASELERTLSDQFHPHLYRNKVVKERTPGELTPSALKLFLVASGAIGMLLGWLGFSYYEKKISPAYKAEAGTFFPTRTIVKVFRRKNRGEDGGEDGNNAGETELQVQNDGEQQSSQNSNGAIYSYQNPNYLGDQNNSGDPSGEATEMKRMDEFTDIKL